MITDLWPPWSSSPPASSAPQSLPPSSSAAALWWLTTTTMAPSPSTSSLPPLSAATLPLSWRRCGWPVLMKMLLKGHQLLTNLELEKYGLDYSFFLSSDTINVCHRVVYNNHSSVFSYLSLFLLISSWSSSQCVRGSARYQQSVPIMKSTRDRKENHRHHHHLSVVIIVIIFQQSISLSLFTILYHIALKQLWKILFFMY